MKKTRYIYLLALLMVAFCSCEKKGYNRPDDDDTPSKPKKVLKYATVNINDTTEGAADIMMLCTDGSYMLCEMDHEGKGGYIYINSNERDVDNGLYVFIDSTGTPTMLQTNKGEYFLKNVTGTSCDIAYMETGGELTNIQAYDYYWNVQTEQTASEQQPRMQKAGEGNPFAQAYTTLVNEYQTFDRTWDVHMLKAAVPFLAKVASFGITAVQIAAKPDLANIGGGIVTLYQEAAKSGLVNEDYMSYSEVFGAFFTSLGNANEWKEWKEIAEKDKFTAKGLKLSLLAMTLNQLADEGLARVTMFDQQTKEVFDHPEYQLHLSTYRIEATPMGGDYTVEVTTQSYWYLDQYSGADWLHVAKDEAHSQILIHVDEHASEQSRYGYVTVHTNSEEIAPSVTLTVMQEGIAFSLSETSMTFTGDKDYKILYVYTNSQVKEWKVKDHPRWLECTKEDNTVFCETSSGFAGSFGEMSEGNIVIEATFNDGTKKTKTCAVQWLPDQSAVWDNTRWNFSGTVTVSYQGQTASTPASFTLIVNNVASNDVYIVVNGTNYACKASEDSAKRLHCSFSNGVGTANFTFTRSGSTASCDYTGPLISGAVESGHFDGTLQ